MYIEIAKEILKDKSITSYLVQMANELYINKNIKKPIEFAKIGLSLKDMYQVKERAIFEASQIERMLIECLEV